MEIAFRQFKGSSPDVRDDVVQYRDADGAVWLVPKDSSVWIDIYEPWLAAGNTPLGPDDPWPTT
ncbi:hypothetical protein Nazgul41 [Burkholderia phage BcepNazgul]|uniref:Uncharacterized protein n=1 Tax=Burkholderia phage BcepNazgul TaxID=242861 RepID=Q6UYK0_9CAUD|nr:hypothetical protein Nazgul41 [Burkholderia phage BcepNazgul]AAQ63341.1 hypothetical protein Nazgul41 [Burkholderia phage BcepNazgul]